MTRILSIVALIIVLSVGSATAGGVVWRDHDTALAEAESADKPVMIHFTADWCGWCKKMKKEVYDLPDVAATLNTDFVPSMVDADKHPDLKARYGVQGLPTIWFVTSEGEGITYIPGYVDAPTFRKVLAWVSSGAYAEQSFEEFSATEG